MGPTHLSGSQALPCHRRRGPSWCPGQVCSGRPSHLSPTRKETGNAEGVTQWGTFGTQNPGFLFFSPSDSQCRSGS